MIFFAHELLARVERLTAENERLRVALEPFATCAEEDELELDYLVGKRGAVAAARTAFQQQAVNSEDK